MTNNRTQYTPLEAIEILGVTPQWIVQKTGLNINAVMRALMGGKRRIHEQTAELIAQALGMSVTEIEWPQELTHLGRPPLSHSIGTHGYQERTGDGSCDEHFLIMYNGLCSYCA